MKKSELILPEIASTTKFIDSHCHLDYLKKSSVAETISTSLENGVSKFITISVDPSNLNSVVEVANDHQQVFCSQGIHPHEAKDYSKEIEQNIIQNCSNKKVVAIGEIGLDYHYNHSPSEVQRKAFEQQLQLATDLKKPVIIHTREAEEDTIAILKNFSKSKLNIVFHSYTSNLKLAEYIWDNQFFIGLNGIITFPKADDVRNIAELTPLDRIMLETDCPFLAPVPHRGIENSPAFVPYIAKALQIIKSNISFEEVADITTKNCESFFMI